MASFPARFGVIQLRDTYITLNLFVTWAKLTVDCKNGSNLPLESPVHSPSSKLIMPYYRSGLRTLVYCIPPDSDLRSLGVGVLVGGKNSTSPLLEFIFMTLQHSGGIDGYSSYVGFNPTKQEGVVILCSCEGKDMPSPVSNP